MSITCWDDIPSIDATLLRGIYSYGYEQPSHIQQQGILPMAQGKDLIAQAQSGTGKTGCFVIGSLLRVDVSLSETQILIISPTRELSIQTKEVVDALGAMMKGLETHLLVGGSSIDEDIHLFRKKTPQIVIGCPGRIHDMIRRRVLSVAKLKTAVLDEADEMLSIGFQDEIRSIVNQFPEDVQICLFSATLPEHVFALADKFMRDPHKITVKTEQLTLEGIQQYYVALETDEQKFEALKDLYSTFSMSQCVIYANSVRRVEELYSAMVDDNFAVSRIHSNMDKRERTKSYSEFKNGSARVLISSDVTARGIDVQQVSTVINFDIPRDVNTYLHRIGRSGRWGRKGMGINFVTPRDIRRIRDIENYYHTEIKELPASIVS
jgi:translation initiation factor 4A